MASLNVGVGSAWKSAKPYLGVSGLWKPVSKAFVGVGGVWKQVYSAFSASVPDGSWADNGAGAYFCFLTAVPSGGAGPYNYAWSVLGGSALADPDNFDGGCTFTGNGTPASVQCVITDMSTGQAATSNPATIS